MGRGASSSSHESPARTTGRDSMCKSVAFVTFSLAALDLIYGGFLFASYLIRVVSAVLMGPRPEFLGGARGFALVVLGLTVTTTGVGLLNQRYWALKLGSAVGIATAMYAVAHLLAGEVFEATWFGCHAIATIIFVIRTENRGSI